MRAESTAHVKTDMAQIIREAKLDPKYDTFMAGRDEITILDVHNSFIKYVRDILPTKDPYCRQVNGSYRCCEIMERLLQSEFYIPSNKGLKWRMIVRNITTLDGIRVGRLDIFNIL